MCREGGRWVILSFVDRNLEAVWGRPPGLRSAPWPAFTTRSGIMLVRIKSAAVGPPAGQGAYPTLRYPEHFDMTD